MNCTIVGNSAVDNIGNGFSNGAYPRGEQTFSAANTITLVNSIVTGNGINDVTGGIDGGYNLTGAADATFLSADSGTVTGVNAADLFATPAAVGGILALKDASPAIDAANDSIAPFVDQRGFPRIDAAADTGAYEFGAEALEVVEKHVTTGEMLDNEITAAEAGKMTILYLDNDIDAVTSSTYGTRGGKGIWVAIDGQGHAIDGKDVMNTALRFANNATDDTRNIVVLRNLTLKNMKSGGAFRYGGGAIAMFGGELKVADSVFENNENEGLSTGNNAGGGAIFVQGNGRLKIDDSVFSGNKTGHKGGAIHANVPISITGTTFDGNKSRQGGAIAVTASGGSGATLDVDAASRFVNNTATQSGGAIHIYAVSGNDYFANPIAATVAASFSGNSDALEGAETDDYVLSANYPTAFTGQVTDDKQDPKFSTLLVEAAGQDVTFFADADRTLPNKVITVATHQELKEALGYVKYSLADESYEMDETGHPILTPGSAGDGDVVALLGDITYATDSRNPSETPRADAVTGATVYVTKNVSIFGNGNLINGDGYPVFDIDGGDATPEAPVTANISNLYVRNGGYSAKLGGAVFVEGDAVLNLNHATFTNCVAGYSGGSDGTVISGGGGAIYLNPHGGGTPRLTAADSTFRGNEAAKGTGGAISAFSGEIVLGAGNAFIGNRAAQGGAVGVKGTGSLTVQAGNTFEGNEATCAGGAIDIHYGRSTSRGATPANSTVDAEFVGTSTFTDNIAQWGENVAYSRYYDDTFPDDGSEPRISYRESTGRYGSPAMEPVHNDLIFSDLFRSTLAGSGDGGDDDDDDDDDDGEVPDDGDDEDEPDDDVPGDETPPPVDAPVTPESDGSVNVAIPATDTNGNTMTIVRIPETDGNAAALAKLEEIGLSAELKDGKLVISGTAEDIGTVVLEVTLSNEETTEVTFTVKALPAVPTTAVDTTPQNWTGTLSEAASGYSFTVYVPVSLAESETAALARGISGSVSMSFIGLVSDHSERLYTPSGRALRALATKPSGAYIESSGTTSDPDTVTVDKATYRIGIRQYEQTLGVGLVSANLDRPAGGGSDNTDTGGSGGCNAGFGALGMALIGLAIMKKRNNR
jgi:predicted outer membrane repeat protein